MSPATERVIVAILEYLADESVAEGCERGINGYTPDTTAAVERALREIKLVLKEAHA